MDEAQKKDMAEMAAARSNVYGFLGNVYRAEPNASFLSALKEPGFTGILEDLGASLGEDFINSPNAKLLEDLAVEYTRLFIGPGPRISPYESLHVDTGNPKNELYSLQTVKVKKFIEGAGLVYDENFTGLPDHISAEFEFMQKITEKEAEAWTNGDDELAADILKIEKRFHDEHLTQWIPGFCGKVIDFAELSFYREMAAVTKEFLEYENKNLTSPRPRRTPETSA